jgi:hypothetical protein
VHCGRGNSCEVRFGDEADNHAPDTYPPCCAAADLYSRCRLVNVILTGHSVRVSAVVLIHFTATWAEPICGPHRIEVRAAADRLGAQVRDVDVDESQEEAKSYRVLQVPSVAIAGDTANAPIPGAQSRDLLVDALRERLADNT